MGLFDSVIGSVLGNNPNAGALQSVLGSILGGQTSQNQPQGPQYGGQPSGLTSLVNTFERAGLGQVVGSWIGNGANQQVSPSQLQQAFGQQQVQQWSQQTGMPAGSLLEHLAQFLPHAVDRATPNGEIPSGASPFDDAGTELPPRRA